MDKQGEVTVFVQNQVKTVSLALSCVPWWPKHLGRQKPKRIFPMLCKKSCLPNPTLKQIPDKLNATILCSTPPPWQISSYSWEHSPVSKKGRSLRSLLSCSQSSPPCRWGCKLQVGSSLTHPLLPSWEGSPWLPSTLSQSFWECSKIMELTIHAFECLYLYLPLPERFLTISSSHF